MRESFLLAWRALARGHVVTLLTAATALTHFAAPALVRSDGTADGWREMFTRLAGGGVFTFTAAALLGCACGFFARARETNRLALTVVRPVRAFSVAAGTWLALAAAAALVLAFNAALFAARGGWNVCSHVTRPDLPPVAEAARAALDGYLKDPQTPEEVRKAPPRAVLTLLANKELDRYDTLAPGQTFAWPFAPAAAGTDVAPRVRVRFATQMDLRAPVAGTFTFGAWSGAVSNSTQSVIEVPLARTGAAAADGPAALTFRNDSATAVMLRPRRDLEILTRADAFGWNLARATAQMWALTVCLCAFGLFLSSALSRPVALFTAFVSLAVALMAPDVVAQFPDELDVPLTDRIGLGISRAVSGLTSAFTDPSPLADLATDTCVELPALFRALLCDAILFPLFFLALSAVILRRKPLSSNF